jgi:glucose/arabinose dehydrogenase
MKYRGDDGKEHDAGKEGQTLSTFTPHRSPLGLVFATEAKLPTPWRSSDAQFNAFLVSWGAAGGTLSDKGQDLLFLQLFKKDGHYETTTLQIATGFKNPIDAVLIDNKLYILEYGDSAAIWELTFQ